MEGSQKVLSDADEEILGLPLSEAKHLAERRTV